VPLSAAEQGTNNLADLIGQFGVGFYSAFMAADWIRVTSRSYRPDSEAAVWYSTGSDTYSVEPAEKQSRGTEVVIKLNADSEEFADESRLRSIIKKHSDYIPYPIYLGESSEQVNRQTAIWRQNPRQVEEKDYIEFYKQLTLEFEEPLTHVHLNIDAPVQMYALLYVPASSERNMFSLRRQDGVALYARKVLIQEYNKDLLPEYFRFIQGVIDSEDIPLNVSREAVQSSRVMGQLKKVDHFQIDRRLQKSGKRETGYLHEILGAIPPVYQRRCFY
jgi:HSP90 family molecular chaperone